MNSRITSEKQFAQNPDKYRDDPLFAEGEDLRLMVQSITIPKVKTVLDIGTGAGHTALAFSKVAEEKCYGIDVTEQMVQVATKLAKDRGISNVHFQIGDAENIPFENQSFCIVTCRFAAHHFVNVEKCIQEISRVLKPGGIFMLVDHYAPEESELDAFINTLDQLRDPSHVREYSLLEWKNLFDKNGLSYREIYKWDLPIKYQNWIERAATPKDKQQKLMDHFQLATPSCKETFQIKLDGNRYPQSFCLKSILLHGVKN
jgi:SAM-dependent methyltransferase